MLSEKIKTEEKCLTDQDKIAWRNLNRVLEEKGLSKPIDKARFLGVTAQHYNGWSKGARGFGKKTIARFTSKTGLTENQLYSTEGVNDLDLEKELKNHPQYKAAIGLLLSGDKEGADNVMRHYIEKILPAGI